MKARRLVRAVSKNPQATAADQRHAPRLCSAGIHPQSSAMIQSITDICKQHLPGRNELEVVDSWA